MPIYLNVIYFKKSMVVVTKHERLFALTLLVMEVFYHVWMIGLEDGI